MKRAILAYLLILFAASLVAAPSAVSELPPTVGALRGAPLAATATPPTPVGSTVRPAARVQFDPGSGTPPRTASEPIAPSGAISATRQGTWAYAKPSHGSRYLAIPEGPGILVTVCGPADCLDRVSTDAGPELYLQRAGRIGDLSAVDFEAVCGVPRSAGLCSGSYTILDGADERMRAEVRGDELYTLPPTDVAP